MIGIKRVRANGVFQHQIERFFKLHGHGDLNTIYYFCMNEPVRMAYNRTSRRRMIPSRHQILKILKRSKCKIIREDWHIVDIRPSRMILARIKKMES